MGFLAGWVDDRGTEGCAGPGLMCACVTGGWGGGASEEPGWRHTDTCVGPFTQHEVPSQA